MSFEILKTITLSSKVRRTVSSFPEMRKLKLANQFDLIDNEPYIGDFVTGDLVEYADNLGNYALFYIDMEDKTSVDDGWNIIVTEDETRIKRSIIANTQSELGTPDDVDKLGLWLDGHDADTLYDDTSGGSLVAADGEVKRWEDKSGSNRHFPGGNPIRRVGSINGKDALEFGGDDTLSITEELMNSSTDQGSLFFVAKEMGSSGPENLGTEEFSIANEVGDVTYYAVAPSGYTYSSEQDTNYDTRKYNTLAAAVAALPATASTPIVINIIGSWTSADTAAVFIAGVTTTASNYLLIRAIGTARHEGVWSESKYRLEVVDSSPFMSNTGFVRVDGLLMRRDPSSTGTASVFESAFNAAPQDIRLSNSIIRGAGNPAVTDFGINAIRWDMVLSVWNTIIYDCEDPGNNAGAFVIQAATSIDIYSCVIIGKIYGIQILNGDVTAKNCYASGTSGNAYVGTMTKTACASSDTTGSAGLQNISYDNTTFVNTTSGSEDHHLADGSSLIDVGVDTSNQIVATTTDIIGNTRQDPWDVGVFGGLEEGATVTEFDTGAAGTEAVYWAIAPTGYSYSAEQDSYYGTNKSVTLADAVAGASAEYSFSGITVPLVFNIIGDWSGEAADTSVADINSSDFWGLTYGIIVRCIGDARHEGTWSDSKYRLISSGQFYAMYLQQDNITVDGLLISISSENAPAISTSGSTSIIIKNCILKGAGYGHYSWAINGGSTTDLIKIWNCVIYNWGFDYAVKSLADLMEVYSSVVIGYYDGMSVSGTGKVMAVKNTYACSVGDSPPEWGPTYAYQSGVTLTNCASSDETGSAGLWNIPHDATTFVNATVGSENYRPADGSPLLDAGTNTSADQSETSTDILGYTREDPWDIGAFGGAVPEESSGEITSTNVMISTRDTASTGWHLQGDESNIEYSHAGHTPTLSGARPTGVSLYEFVRNGLNIELFIDGVLKDSRTIDGFTAASAGTWIAANADGTFKFIGFICEIIYYERLVTSAERGRIESYLANKWGLNFTPSDGLWVENTDITVEAANALNNLFDDGNVTPIEKTSLRPQWDEVAVEAPYVILKANNFGITTEATNLDNAFQALGDYLNGGATWTTGTVPAWINGEAMFETTVLADYTTDRATFRSKWEDYHDARGIARNKIIDFLDTPNYVQNKRTWHNYTGSVDLWGGGTANITNGSFPFGSEYIIGTATINVRNVDKVVKMFGLLNMNDENKPLEVTIKAYRGSTEVDIGHISLMSYDETPGTGDVVFTLTLQGTNNNSINLYASNFIVEET